MSWWAIWSAALGAFAAWLILDDRALRRLAEPRRRPWGWGWGGSAGVGWGGSAGLGWGGSAPPHWRWRGRGEQVREAAIKADVPAVCDLLAVCLEAGLPARGALRQVAGASRDPTSEVLGRVLNQIELGDAEPAAWASLGEQPGYREMARDLARSVESGVALAETLRQHARDARRGAVLESQLRARRVGVGAVIPMTACSLPAFLLIGIVPIFGGLVGRLFGG